MQGRLQARDRFLEPLLVERDSILGDAAGAPLLAFVDRALAAQRAIDRLFWIDEAGRFIRQHNEDQRPALFRAAARRIHTTFRSHRRLRYSLERILARALWPLS